MAARGAGAAAGDAGYVFLHPGASEIGARDVAAFRKGLQETGYIEGQNVTVEYHWLEGQYGRLPAVMADAIRRPVAVIAIPGSVVAARATSTWLWTELNKSLIVNSRHFGARRATAPRRTHHQGSQRVTNPRCRFD